MGRRDMRLTGSTLREASDRVARYLRSLALLNLGHGIAVGVGLALIGLPVHCSSDSSRVCCVSCPMQGRWWPRLRRSCWRSRPSTAGRWRSESPFSRRSRALQQQRLRALAVREERWPLALRGNPVGHLLGVAVGTDRPRARDPAHGLRRRHGRHIPGLETLSILLSDSEALDPAERGLRAPARSRPRKARRSS